MKKNEWIAVIQESTIHNIKSISELPLVAGTHRVVKSLEPLEGTVSACLDFEMGKLLLSFPRASFQMVVEGVLKEPIVVDENLSFATELLNMIYGKVKTAANGKGLALGLSRPYLIDKDFPSTAGKDVDLFPFSIEQGKGLFVVLITEAGSIS